MALGDGWTSRLLTGCAEDLDAAGIGVWRPDGPAYAADETGILIRLIPQAPDRIVTLAAYPIGGEDPGMADHDTAIQFRLRGTTDPRVCDDLADAVYDLLHGARALTWGGIPIIRMRRQSYTSLGADSNGRWERSENYYLLTMRPTSNNTD